MHIDRYNYYLIAEFFSWKNKSVWKVERLLDMRRVLFIFKLHIVE